MKLILALLLFVSVAVGQTHRHNHTPKFFAVTFTIGYDSLTLLSASQIERDLRDAFPRVKIDVTVSEIPKPPQGLRFSIDTIGVLPKFDWNGYWRRPIKVDDGLDSTLWRIDK